MDAALFAALALSRLGRRPTGSRNWARVFHDMHRLRWESTRFTAQRMHGRETVMTREQRRLEAERERVCHKAYLEQRERTVLESLTGNDIERMRQAEAKRRRKAGRILRMSGVIVV